MYLSVIFENPTSGSNKNFLLNVIEIANLEIQRRERGNLYNGRIMVIIDNVKKNITQITDDELFDLQGRIYDYLFP